jgi:hypothetical protein
MRGHRGSQIKRMVTGVSRFEARSLILIQDLSCWHTPSYRRGGTVQEYETSCCQWVEVHCTQRGPCRFELFNLAFSATDFKYCVIFIAFRYTKESLMV